MYIPEELKKENIFIDVAIPSNRSFFQRLGATAVPEVNYSGDVPVEMFKDKLETDMEMLEEFDRIRAEEESKSK